MSKTLHIHGRNLPGGQETSTLMTALGTDLECLPVVSDEVQALTSHSGPLKPPLIKWMLVQSRVTARCVSGNSSETLIFIVPKDMLFWASRCQSWRRGMSQNALVPHAHQQDGCRFVLFSYSWTDSRGKILHSEKSYLVKAFKIELAKASSWIKCKFSWIQWES